MMRVTLLAATQVTPDLIEYDSDREYNADPADLLAEYAGRNCYQSFNRPNAATASNRDYLANILKQMHFSVLEHASVTFMLEGVSRSLLAELTRHRHLSFSVLSQRFVDSATAECVIPPAIRDTDEEFDLVQGAFQDAIDTYETLAASLMASGLPRKQAREAARCVLPNMTETKIVVTGNHRAWREVLAKRNSPGADAEIQELARELLLWLKDLAPNTYQDM